MRKFSKEYMKTSKQWTPFGKGKLDWSCFKMKGLLYEITESRMRGKPMTVRRIQMLHDFANNDGYTALKWAAENREGWRHTERMSKHALQQKKTVTQPTVSKHWWHLANQKSFITKLAVLIISVQNSTKIVLYCMLKYRDKDCSHTDFNNAFFQMHLPKNAKLHKHIEVSIKMKHKHGSLYLVAYVRHLHKYSLA